MLREIRKEGLKNIQAHESYSDLRLREWEKHTQPISKLSNEILRGWEKKKKSARPDDFSEATSEHKKLYSRIWDKYMAQSHLF